MSAPRTAVTSDGTGRASGQALPREAAGQRPPCSRVVGALGARGSHCVGHHSWALGDGRASVRSCGPSAPGWGRLYCVVGEGHGGKRGQPPGEPGGCHQAGPAPARHRHGSTCDRPPGPGNKEKSQDPVCWLRGTPELCPRVPDTHQDRPRGCVRAGAQPCRDSLPPLPLGESEKADSRAPRAK